MSSTGSERRIPDTLWSFAGTAVRLGGGVILLPILLVCLPPAEAGAWFILSSIGALVLRLDLGSAATVQRGLTCLLAGTGRIDGTGIADTTPSDQAIASFVRTARDAYVCLVCGAAVISGAACLTTFNRPPNQANPEGIVIAAAAYVLGMCANLGSGCWAAMAAACGGIAAQQRIGVLAGLSGMTVSAVGLLLGAGLPALGAGTCITGFTLLFGNRRLALRDLGPARSPGPDTTFDRQWLSQAWPMIWRVGLISLGGWLISYACTFAAASRLGLAETARYGASLTMLQLAMSVASIPLQVRIPALCDAFARRNHASARSLFLQGHRLGLVAIGVAACILVAIGDLLLTALGSHTRILDPPLLGLLAVVILLEFNHSNCAVAVMAAHRAPFVTAAVASGLAIALLGPWSATHWGMLGLILLPGAVQLLWNNWYPPFILSRLLRS